MKKIQSRNSKTQNWKKKKEKKWLAEIRGEKTEENDKNISEMKTDTK